MWHRHRSVYVEELMEVDNVLLAKIMQKFQHQGCVTMGSATPSLLAFLRQNHFNVPQVKFITGIVQYTKYIKNSMKQTIHTHLTNFSCITMLCLTKQRIFFKTVSQNLLIKVAKQHYRLLHCTLFCNFHYCFIYVWPKNSFEKNDTF